VQEDGKVKRGERQRKEGDRWERREGKEWELKGGHRMGVKFTLP